MKRAMPFFQVMDVTHEVLNEEKTIEKDLDEKMKNGHIEKIKRVLTPETFAKCETNTLIKVLQVNSELHKLARRNGPDEAEITKLIGKVESFAVTLLDPLMFDKELLSAFKPSSDLVIEKAIDCKLKKVLSHPVIFNLLKLKWYGRFITYRDAHSNYWEWFFWTFWTFFDILFFPVIFTVLFILHMVNRNKRKKKGFTLVFVGSPRANWPRKVICSAVKFVEKRLGSKPLLFGFSPEGINISGSSFDKALQSAKAALEEDFSNDFQALVPFTSDLKEADSVVNIIASEKDAFQGSHCHVIPVALGLNTSLKKLKKVAYNKRVIHWCEKSDSKEASDQLGKEITRNIEGDDMYDRYLEYCTTPYVIFTRDVNSQMTLLALHFYMCLTPSHISFSFYEGAIFVFFLGQIATEVEQWFDSDTSVEAQVTKKDRDTYMQFQRYFSDRWNFIDCITVFVYTALFVLRMITWSKSSIVPGDRLLAVAGYLYGLNSMFLTLRLFGHWMETTRSMGVIQIALFRVIRFLASILVQFLAVILAFSLVITKINIAERSYMSENSESALNCWFNISEWLTWSLVGMENKDTFQHSDSVSKNLAHIFYGIYLVLGGMLLVNMMIALLSNTYQRVEDNSNVEWTYKMAITIQTYERYHPVPVPLNLICILLAFLKNHSCKKNKGDKQALKSDLLDEVVEKLNRIYLDTNGNMLPPTEEDKYDSVISELQEIRRTEETRYKNMINELVENRRMAHQFAFKVLQQGGMNQCNLPVGPQAWQSDFIKINECQLTYDGRDRSYHGARHRFPFTQTFPKFEVLIQETGQALCLVVGVVWHDYDLHNLPGHEDETLGYHVDTGKIFPEQTKCDEEKKDAVVDRGDLIGCEVKFEKSISATVLFSLNGHEVARRNIPTRIRANKQEDVFPFISMGCEGIQVLAKMCPPSDGKSAGIITEYEKYTMV